MDLDKGLKKSICWKCRWLTTEHGFLKRKKKVGPCDRCLKKVTIFQQAWEKEIWLKHIPLPEIKKQPNKPKKESIESSEDTHSLNSDAQSS